MKSIIKYKKIIILLFIVFSIIIIYYIYTVFFNNTNKVFIQTNFNLTYNVNSATSFYLHNKDMFFLLKDGIKFINNKGEEVWSQVFSLNYPVLIGEGGNTLVIEQRGKKVYAFNKKGMLFERDMEGEIIFASINQNGYVSVILEIEDDYKIKAYNTKGKEIALLPVRTGNNIPTSVDISNDNRILAYSVLDINNIEMSSKLVFYHLDTEESNQKANNKTIAGKKFDNQIISNLKFMKNNLLVCISDEQITFLKESNQEVFSELSNVSPNNKIKKLYFNEDESFAIGYGIPKLNQKGISKGTINIFDYNTKIISNITTNMDLTHLYINNNSIIAGENTKFNSYDFKGKQYWEYNSIQNVKQIFLYGNKNRILEVTDIDAKILEYQKILNIK